LNYRREAPHAIAEASLGLILSEPLRRNRVDALDAAHENKFSAQFPKINKPQFIAINVGPNSVQGEPPAATSFEVYQSNGQLARKLTAEESVVSVTEYAYERWDDFKGIAFYQLQQMMEVMQVPLSGVAALTLQYVDIFTNKCNREEYKIHELVPEGCPYIPADFAARGPFWHLHQGWFEILDNDRLLNRIHIDAAENPVPGYFVKYDHILKLDVIPPNGSTKVSWDQIYDAYEKLHIKNKEVLKKFLVDDMQERIRLKNVC